MTDIRTYVLPNEVWALETHLAVAGPKGQPIYCVKIGNQIWEIKDARGYPWDGYTFDERFLYQSITENDKAPWDSPGYSSSFKIFRSHSWPGANGGIAWCPTYFNEGGANTPVVTPDSSYQYFAAGQPVLPVLNLGPVMTTVEGPYVKDFGGDLKQQNAIVMRYFRDAGNMEVNYYVKGYGRVQWELWRIGVDGLYALVKTSAFNTFVAGGVPNLVFPSGVPVIA